MDLYLMQHGEAKAESEDPARPLSERGRQEVERVARHAARLRLGIALVEHSGKLRALQTAEIVASHLEPRPRVEERPGLAPNDDPADLARALQQASEPRLVVGHLPFLARLVSLLVVGDPSRPILAFRMGALVALGREAEGFRLRFVLPPELVADEAI
jgi:phosphohistidine phosphatase